MVKLGRGNRIAGCGSTEFQTKDEGGGVIMSTFEAIPLMKIMVFS